MDNNDILIRLRYALDIKNSDMVKIFEHGGKKVTKDEVHKLLTKAPDEEMDEMETEDHLKCDNESLERFLNGLIIFKRGKQEPKPGQPDTPPLTLKNSNNVNNVLL